MVKRYILNIIILIFALFIVINYSVYLFSVLSGGGKTWNALVAFGVLLLTVIPALLLLFFEKKATEKSPRLIPFLKYLYVCGMGVYVVSFSIFCVFLTYGLDYSQEDSYDYVIVFGGGIKEGIISPQAKTRLDTALSYYQGHKDTVLILSGGVGEKEKLSEAEVMCEYLIKKGVLRENILLENKASNTWENLEYSFDMIEDGKTVLGISSDYHIKRIEMMADKQGLTLDTLACHNSFSPSRIASYVREYMAYAKYFLNLNHI